MRWISRILNNPDTLFPVSKQSRFDVDATLFGHQQRCYNVKATSRAYWVKSIFHDLVKC